MARILVVTYSFTGSSLRLAQRLCELRGWPLGQIQDRHPRRGIPGTFRCVIDSLLRRQPAIDYSGPALAGFDAVVLIAPIWAKRLASPMRSFVARHHAQLRHFAVVSVMGGNGAPNAAAETAKILGRAPLMSIAFTTRQVDDGSCAARLLAFAQAMETATTDSAPERPAEWSARAA